MSGRFAPSPTGELHVGNLRTAAIAWLAARSTGRRFLVRMEDLDRANSTRDHERRQLESLAAIGLDWDGMVIRQSDRFDRYDAVIAELDRAGLVYPCFCTRREIAEAVSAPHADPASAVERAEAGRFAVLSPAAPGTTAPPGSYPGTCRELSTAERRQRARNRQPAWRLRVEPGSATMSFSDGVAGPTTVLVDDFVLRRNDGVPAYNLAVVVDDADQDVTQVVRADDLLSSTGRHRHLQQLLGAPTPDYLHVPLVLGEDGERLAKRHGATTLSDLAAIAHPLSADIEPAHRVVAWIIDSLDRTTGRGGRRGTSLSALLEQFDVAHIPRRTVTFSAPE